jgi:hypothetical protein
MPFVAIECCGKSQEDYVFPDEVSGLSMSGTCEVCGASVPGSVVMNLSTGHLPMSYGGKTVAQVDREFADYGGAVRHLERGTDEHRRHVAEMREINEAAAKDAGYADRRDMFRKIRARKNGTAAAPPPRRPAQREA